MIGRLPALTKKVFADHPHPHDPLEIAATLESWGLTDHAARRYGAPTVFALAHRLYARKPRRAKAHQEHQEKSRIHPTSYIASFFRGLLFAIPLLAALLSSVMVRFGLWSWTSYGPEEGTSILLALVGSLVFTGPLLLPMVRQGRHYTREGFPLFAFRVARRIALLSIPILAFLLFVVAVIGVTVPPLAPASPLHFIGFLLALTFLWLTTALAYTIERPIFLLFSYVGGNFAASLLHTQLGYPIFPSQIAGIVGLGGILLLLTYLDAWRRERRAKSGQLLRLPNPSAVILVNAPYMLFGLFYMLFLFLDRILAWFVARLSGEVFPLSSYEVGMTISILALLLVGGVMEVIGTYFRGAILPRALRGEKVHLQRFYIVAIISFGVAVFLGRGLLVSDESFLALSRLFVIPQSAVPAVASIMTWGIAAYALIFWGLLQAFLLFELGEIRPVLYILLGAVLLEIVIGLPLALLYHPLYVLVGMLAGSTFFAVAMTVRFLRRLYFLPRELPLPAI